MTQTPLDYTLRAGANPRPVDWAEPPDPHDHRALAALATSSLVVYADIAEFQPPLDSSYPYQMIACRVDNGSRLDNNISVNWARASSDPKIRIFVGYLVFQSGALSGVMARIKQVFGKTCPGKVVFRIDMESGSQFAGPGDHSAEANQWVAALAAYMATATREDGYANSGDWSGLWSNIPHGFKRVLADYTDQLPAGWYGYQYYGGLDYPTPAGLPRSCPPFGAWVDMNVTYRTIDQMMSDYGLAQPTPAPPTPSKDNDMGYALVRFEGPDVKTKATYLSNQISQVWVRDPADLHSKQVWLKSFGADTQVHPTTGPRYQFGVLDGPDPEALTALPAEADFGTVHDAVSALPTATKRSWVHTYLLDPLERAVSTFVQQFVVILSVSSGATLLITQNWLMAADTAGFAAILSLLTSLLTFGIPKLPPAWDLLLRVLKTFGQSLFGSLAASVVAPSVVHAPWLGALAIAVPVALTAFLKGLAALAVPQTEGASLLPATQSS